MSPAKKTRRGKATKAPSNDTKPEIVHQGPTMAHHVPPQQPVRKIGDRWNDYWGAGDLAAWQKLVSDLGIEGDFPSKTQCRKALKDVWVNIVDFLNAVRDGEEVHHFESQSALRKYTRKERKFFPLEMAKEDGSPLQGLLARINYY